MKEVYQVIFTKLKNGKYLVEAPDLECITEGKNLNDAIRMVRDAIGIKGIEIEDCGEKIPKSSNNVILKNGIFFNQGNSVISYVDVDFDDYRRSLDSKMIRKNVSIPTWMNRAVEKEHLNISKILQDAIYNLIGKKYLNN